MSYYWQGIYVKRGSTWTPLRGQFTGEPCATCGDKDPIMYRLQPEGPSYCQKHRDGRKLDDQTS